MDTTFSCTFIHNGRTPAIKAMAIGSLAGTGRSSAIQTSRSGLCLSAASNTWRRCSARSTQAMPVCHFVQGRGVLRLQIHCCRFSANSGLPLT